jgi:putative NIF3 family GTP cyclohydrolase 1 type 2
MNSQNKNIWNRRRFLHHVLAAVAGTSAANAVAASPATLTAGQLHAYLNSLDDGWVNWDDTVDTIKAGDPDTPITGIAVGWMSYTHALKQALKLGCNVFVSHEPTYYYHKPPDPTIFRFDTARDKKTFIEDSGIVIMRCHDVWDRLPDICIPLAWGRFLGFGEPIDGSGYHYIYDGGGRTAGEIARGIATKTATLGQQAVQFIGPQERPIHRIAIGCGAATSMFRFIERYEADLAVCSDDGFTYWKDGAYAVDADYPVVVVHHPVSEEPGAGAIADHLRDKYPNIPVHHIPQQCMYQLITA